MILCVCSVSKNYLFETNVKTLTWIRIFKNMDKEDSSSSESGEDGFGYGEIDGENGGYVQWIEDDDELEGMELQSDCVPDGNEVEQDAGNSLVESVEAMDVSEFDDLIARIEANGCESKPSFRSSH